MTDKTHTPFKEAFKDSIIAKNLLANYTCEFCLYCRKTQSDYWFGKEVPQIKKHFTCNLHETSTTLDKTCEDFELNETAWLISDIQANKNTKFF